MLQGKVESISKTSIVVSTGNDVLTLSGAAVEKIAPTLTLGQYLEFDNNAQPTVVQKPAAKKAVAPQATAAPRASSSPTERLHPSMAAVGDYDNTIKGGVNSTWK